MQPWIWLVIVVVVLAIVAVVVWAAERRRRRTAALQERFGPEYDRTMRSEHGRRSAEERLAARARRREQLNLVPLPETARLRYAEQWRSLQEQFVDRPGESVDSAGTLLTRVMGERGYPTTGFDEQAELVSVDHPDVVENYRVAHDISRRNADRQASTEDLREAMLRYRSLFDELLRPDPASPGVTGGEHEPRHRVDDDLDLTSDGPHATAPAPEAAPVPRDVRTGGAGAHRPGE